ncbi:MULTISPECIES: hypothetical protein [unclassified Nocardia]|uniref:hypothetical protein n=1 Tax=unclassified Nocardia TaxID=2637762 RepID=UPI001CE3EB4A|nr:MULTISPECIES: hypothetical protein [unclassified Nocardia]
MCAPDAGGGRVDRYEVRKFHSCEFCGTEEIVLGGPYRTRAEAEAAAEADACRTLTWTWFRTAGEWPLWSDPEDGTWIYHIYGPPVPNGEAAQ